MDKLSKILLQSKRILEGCIAIDKLSKESGVSKKEAAAFPKETDCVANLPTPSKIHS